MRIKTLDDGCHETYRDDLSPSLHNVLGMEYVALGCGEKLRFSKRSSLSSESRLSATSTARTKSSNDF